MVEQLSVNSLCTDVYAYYKMNDNFCKFLSGNQTLTVNNKSFFFNYIVVQILNLSHLL